jgi:hypothetical protein
VIIFLREEGSEVVGLPYPNFEREHSTGKQAISRCADQLPHQFIAALAGENGDCGIMQHLA